MIDGQATEVLIQFTASSLGRQRETHPTARVNFPHVWAETAFLGTAALASVTPGKQC